MRNKKTDSKIWKYIQTASAIVLAIMSGGIAAQETNPTHAINDVKRQPDKYIYAEFTSSSPDEAYENAMTILKDAILNALIPAAPENRQFAEDLAKNAVIIKAKRGSLNRIFAYINRDALSSEGSKSLSRISLGNKPETQEKEGLPTKTTEMQPIKNESDQEEETILILDDSIETAQENYSLFEISLMKVDKASQIESFVRDAKAKGNISKYGRLKDIPSDGRCYIFIFNRENEIVAYLEKNGSVISNLQTGSPEEIDNYKGCGCIWMK